MMITNITNFLITEWIWSFTGGLSHVPINIFLLCMLFKLWDTLTWLRAFLLSFFLTSSSFIIFFGFVYLVLVKGLNVVYLLPDNTYSGSYNILNTSLILAAIYSILQLLLIQVAYHGNHFNWWRACACIVSANILSALLVYKITFNV